MSRFTDIYKKMNPEASITKGQICEDPIMAYVKGVSEHEIHEALRMDGWTDPDINNLLTEAKHAKMRLNP